MAFELTPFDRTLTQAVQIVFQENPETASGLPLGESPLPLQFPPRIVSDTKSADWQETFKGSWEPQAVWKGAAARKVSVELTYIVDGAQFTTGRIALISKQCKGYFYREITDTVPIVRMKFYNHVGSAVPGDFRLLDVTVTHGDGAIIQDSDGIFPLLTKIVLNGALITTIEHKQEIPGLQDRPPIDWY